MAGDRPRARKELDQARTLDPQDPTGWFYTALLDQQENRINRRGREPGEIEDPERQPQPVSGRANCWTRNGGVRSANLASMYRDVGMYDRSGRTAPRQ
jgi:hypothetical protein